MSSFFVIGAVAETLKKLLENDPWQGIANKPDITFKSPREIKESGGQNNGVSLFLYQIVENPHLRNLESEVSGAYGNTTLPLVPRLTLDLLYLVTPYHDDKTQEKFILGKVMQIFHDNGILSGTALQGALSGTDEQLRLLLHPISLDELTKIWTAFPEVGYRLSVSYMVTPVRIDSLQGDSSQRVVSKDMHHAFMARKGEKG